MDPQIAKMQLLQHYNVVVLPPDVYKKVRVVNNSWNSAFMKNNGILQRDWLNRQSAPQPYPVFFGFKKRGGESRKFFTKEEMEQIDDFLDNSLHIFYEVFIATSEWCRKFIPTRFLLSHQWQPFFWSDLVRREPFLESFNIFLRPRFLPDAPWISPVRKLPQGTEKQPWAGTEVSLPGSSSINPSNNSPLSTFTDSNLRYSSFSNIVSELSRAVKEGGRCSTTAKRLRASRSRNKNRKRGTTLWAPTTVTTTDLPSFYSPSSASPKNGENSTETDSTIITCWSPFVLPSIGSPPSSVRTPCSMSVWGRKNGIYCLDFLYKELASYSNNKSSDLLPRKGEGLYEVCNSRMAPRHEELTERAKWVLMREKSLLAYSPVARELDSAFLSSVTASCFSCLLSYPPFSVEHRDDDCRRNAATTTALCLLYAASCATCAYTTAYASITSFSSTPRDVTEAAASSLDAKRFPTHSEAKEVRRTSEREPFFLPYPHCLSSSLMEDLASTQTRWSIESSIERERERETEFPLFGTVMCNKTKEMCGNTCARDSRFVKREETRTESAPSNPENSNAAQLALLYSHHHRNRVLGLRLLLEAGGRDFCVHGEAIHEEYQEDPFGTATVTDTTPMVAKDGQTPCSFPALFPPLISTFVSPLCFTRMSYPTFSCDFLSPSPPYRSSCWCSYSTRNKRRRSVEMGCASPVGRSILGYTHGMHCVPLPVLARCVSCLEHLRRLLLAYGIHVCQGIRPLSTSLEQDSSSFFSSMIQPSEASKNSAFPFQSQEEALDRKTPQDDVPVASCGCVVCQNKNCFFGIHSCPPYARYVYGPYEKLSFFAFLAVCQRFYPLRIIRSALPCLENGTAKRELRKELNADPAYSSISFSLSSPPFDPCLLPLTADAQRRAAILMEFCMKEETRKELSPKATIPHSIGETVRGVWPVSGDHKTLSSSVLLLSSTRDSAHGAIEKRSLVTATNDKGDSHPDDWERWSAIPWLIRCDVLMSYPHLSSLEQLAMMEDVSADYQRHRHAKLDHHEEEDHGLHPRRMASPMPSETENGFSSCVSQKEREGVKGVGGSAVEGHCRPLAFLEGMEKAVHTKTVTTVPCTTTSTRDGLETSLDAVNLQRTLESFTEVQQAQNMERMRVQEKTKIHSTDVPGPKEAEEECEEASFEQWWSRSDSPVPLHWILAGLLPPLAEAAVRAVAHLEGLEAVWGFTGTTSPVRRGPPMEHPPTQEAKNANRGDQRGKKDGEEPDVVPCRGDQKPTSDVYTMLREALERHKQSGVLRILWRGRAYLHVRSHYYAYWVNSKQEGNEKIL